MTKSNKIYKFLFVFVFLFIVFGLAACDNADKKAAKAVDSAIEALPAEVTLADEEAIVSAREEYDKLTDKQKELVTKLEILETKEAELKDLKDIKSVEDLIALIPETVTLADNAKIQAARTAYNALKSALQSKVSNYNKLQAAETAYQALVASKEAVDEVIDLIDELPDVDDVTLDDKEDVLAAKAAYDALTATEKSQVTNASKLTDLLTKIAQLEADEADREAAEAVDLKIALLPAVVQLTDKEAVEEARAMYDALTEAQKALVTGLNKLTAAETRIVDLEAAKVVIDMIAALPETLTLDDEDDVVAAREAFEALSEVRKGMVTNLDLLKEKEEEIEILKNPDLAVLNPLIKQIPDQIIDDFTFPTAEGVTWAYKDGEDDSLFDLEAGILLKTSFETALRTIEVSYGETTLELVINFGVVKEDFTPIFYVGGAAADKPAEGNNWDGYGTWDKQLAKTGFGGYLIEYGNKVYFISKDAFIPLVGTEENEHLDRETLRPLGMNGQDSRNNLGLINGIPTEYAGTAALYYNAGDVPIKFYGCDTYGRVNAVFAGYGKVVFSRQEDGSYKVGPMIPEHGGGDDVGTKEGSYIITLNPGDYLWTPHTWETDYNNSGFGTRLCSAQGVLTENSPITVKKFKFVDVLLVVSGSNETSVGEQITLTANLPVTWSSSDETIATVDENGVVTPLAHGEVTIYARSGGQVIGHEIKVYPLPNEIIYEGSEEVLVGGTTKALYKVLAEEGEALQRLVAFESSNTSVFTVNESGIITGVSEGEAILKIKSTLDETVFVEVTVTVLLEDYEFDMSKVAVSGSHVDMEAFVLNGELYVIGKNAFNTLADALTAVGDGATIYVAEGIYANNATVSKNNIKIEGVGKAIIKGTISVSSGVSDLTVKKLNFTDAGQVLIAAAGNVSNFTFEDNYIYDSTATVVSFTNNGTANNSNFVIRNNIFEVVDLKTLTARYIRGGNIVNLTIENNVFVGIKGQYVDAIRIEGNNDANAAGVGASGKVIIKGNLFKNIGQRAIWLRRYSATLVQIYDNEFNYAGDQNYGGGIQLEIWVSGQQTDILIKKNTFKNIEGSFGIRLNNSGLTADATWKVEINYNKFIDFLYPANYDDYVQAYSDAAKGLINADYNYFSVAPTADRMPYVGSYDHQFASEDEVFFAITFAKEFSVGDVVEVMGVVTSRVGNNAFIQDSTGGIYLYLGGNSDYSDILVLGNLVKVIGKLDNYYNLVQIKGIESIELVEEDKGMPEAVEFEDELEFSDLLALQGSIVTIKGFAIKTIPTIGTKSYNVIITNGTIDLTVRVDQYIDAYNDVKNAMNALLVGQYVDFYNIPVSQYNAAPQLMLSTLEQMDVIPPLSDDVVADLIADVIKSKYDGKIFPMGDVIELITSVEGFAGEITWSADSEVIDLETGLIAEVTEDTNVNLTATILVDEVEITETVAILVKCVEPAELEFKFDFEGGLDTSYVKDTSTATYKNLVDNSDFDVEVHSCAGNTSSVAFATKALVLRPRTGDNDGIAWAEFDFGDVDVKRMTFDAYYWSNESIPLMTKFELQVKVGEDWVTAFDILEFLDSSLDINTITVYDLEGSIFRFYAEGGENKSNYARVLVDNLFVYA